MWFFLFSAIIQSIIGLVTVIFGVTLLFYRKDNSSSDDWVVPFVVSILGICGIIEGLLVVCIAGAVGIASCIDPQSHYKNAKFMGCSICVCCLSVVGIGFFSAGLAA